MDENAQSRNQRAEEDLWKRTLRQIPTTFGRLAYLSRLRDAETDRYEHHGLSAVFGAEAAEEALRESHVSVLETWLGYSLQAQRQDLDLYLESLPQSRKRSIAAWHRSQPYLQFLPSRASEAQRELFAANVQLLLLSLLDEKAKDEPGVNPAD